MYAVYNTHAYCRLEYIVSVETLTDLTKSGLPHCDFQLVTAMTFHCPKFATPVSDPTDTKFTLVKSKVQWVN